MTASTLQTMSRAFAACIATTLLLRSGQTTLTVTAVPDQCANATAMELWRKSFEPIPHRSDQPYEMFFWGTSLLGRGAIKVWFLRSEREPVGPECRWSFSDLPDGEYVALLTGPGGSGGSQHGTLSAGTTQTIEIPSPTVTLSGVVTVAGTPQAGAVLIRDQAWSRPSVTVTTDADGRYAVMLDRPATYTISVQITSLGRRRVVALHEGANQLDLP